MIALEFDNIEELKRMHYEAVKDYITSHLSSDAVEALYEEIMTLPHIGCSNGKIDSKDFSWLEHFILAAPEILEDWSDNHARKLKFKVFKKLYETRFSNGADNYVDSARTYNSYVLFRKMGVKVCPYCEHEYIQALEIHSRPRRTMEFDHFYPKGDNDYPGLAMCFYNLIPSCISCNRLKMSNRIGMNPYQSDIEHYTRLFPDLPIGINMESVVDESACAVHFHAKGDMKSNVDILGLEQRYEPLSSDVYKLLKNKQDYSMDKLEELERAGFGTKESFMRAIFGKPRSEAKGKELHTKMKEDLIGY